MPEDKPKKSEAEPRSQAKPRNERAAREAKPDPDPKPDPTVMPPKYESLTEGYDPKKDETKIHLEDKKSKKSRGTGRPQSDNR